VRAGSVNSRSVTAEELKYNGVMSGQESCLMWIDADRHVIEIARFGDLDDQALIGSEKLQKIVRRLHPKPLS